MNILIDCGANLGQGYERLLQRFDLTTYKVYMFDILKTACDYLKKQYPEAEVINSGVWNEDVDRVVKIEKANIDGISDVGHESNILQDIHKKTISGQYHSWDEQTIKCIDFAKFLKNNFTTNDNILVKMDIEGAEFEVIEHLIATDTLKYIKQLHIEWHPHMRTDNHKDLDYYMKCLKDCNIQLL